jgi:hypothetical protein
MKTGVREAEHANQNRAAVLLERQISSYWPSSKEVMLYVCKSFQRV